MPLRQAQGHRRMLRRSTGRIIGVDYADILLSCPHLRCLQAEKSGALQAPHFSAFRQPFGLEHNRYVPPTMPAAWGSLVESIAIGNANVAVPLPRLPSVAPMRKSRTRQAARQLAGIQQTNGFTIRLDHFIAGEPPDPVPLVRKLQASGRRSSVSSLRPTLPPQPSRKSAETFFAPAPDSRSLRIARGPHPSIHDRSTVPVDVSAAVQRSPRSARPVRISATGGKPAHSGRAVKKRSRRIAQNARS